MFVSTSVKADNVTVPAPSRLSIDVDPSFHLAHAGIYGFLELLATLR
jgi:hypothetical protein